MKTIVLEEPGVLHLTSSEEPGKPASGMAFVRVHRVGICGTDLHAYRGRQPFFSYPRILGHELAVEILALGDGATSQTTAGGHVLNVGDVCAVEPYLYCGVCGSCRRGRTNCCEKMQVLGVHVDGGMRELIQVPVDKLYPSKSVPLDHLALVEMLCIGAHAVSRAAITPGERVLVIGAGPIGLSTVRFAQLAGGDVAVLEVNPQRLAFCQQQLGVDVGLTDPATAAEQLSDQFGGSLPTLVFDATGNVTSMNQSFAYPANGGRLVFVGLVQDHITFFDPEFHRRELTLLSSRNATAADFRTVIAALEAGEINLTPWITHHATPESLPDALPTWLMPEERVVKAMLDLA